MNEPEPKQALATPFSLRAFTPARVSLARTGNSLTTAEILNFSLAHAQARDAVYAELETERLLDQLRDRQLDPIVVHSAAPDRPTYLRRPDLGRILAEHPPGLPPVAARETSTPPRLTLILADGLSALATNRHAIPLLDELLPLMSPHFHLTPVIVALQARVALGDAIGEMLQSDLSVILIGERPGLSAADSLGAYLTWKPRHGRTDAERNCVSNIRTEGLDYRAAAMRLASLCLEARQRQITGTTLKESSTGWLLPPPSSAPGTSAPAPAAVFDPGTVS